jgi:hypothetical protein
MAMPEFQHCPTCDEEYAASATACAECGAALTPGPLPRLEHGSRAAGSAEPAAGATLDRLLTRMPGKQADHAVRALLLEAIPCRVECDGHEKTYTPERPPMEPFAISRPVAVYVAADQLDPAQAVLDSFTDGDLIGDQWNTASAETEIEIDATDAGADLDDTPSASEPIEPEGTSIGTALVVGAVIIALLLLFAR